MTTPEFNDWDRIQNYANQKLSDNFAAAVVQRAQKQRYADRQRNTMIAVACVCVLGVLGTSWFSKNSEASESEIQWQCLYVENEVMRTSI